MRLRYHTLLVVALTTAASVTKAGGQQARTAARTTDAHSPAALTMAPGFTPLYLPLQQHGDETNGARMVAVGKESLASPYSFGLEYSLYSDYIFRGINFSEFPREGRERLNHQLSVDFGVDLGLLFDRDGGSLGSLSFNTWFEWFGAQKKIDPDAGGQNLQEVDYSIAWSYDMEPIATTLTLGYVFYAFPNAKIANTQEWTVALKHNDAWMWKWLWADNEDGVLNPSIFYAMDVVAAPGGSWLELGISHDWQVVENVTVTPGITVAVDHRYLDPILGTGRGGSTRLAYVQYGLTVGYDLSAAWDLPERSGSWSMAGFLYFNDALGRAEESGAIQDEFFGGVSIGVSF